MTIPAAHPFSRRDFQLPILGLFLLLATLIVRSAWLGDDAYIPIRTVDNLLNGYGLRWNIDERVQVFTDPFWTFLTAACYAVTHEIFITTIVLCIVTSLCAVGVLIKLGSASAAAAIVSLVALISSKAFVDYTTSGLENPLNYLLVGLFSVILLRGPVTRRTFNYLILLYALVGFNRLDLLLLLLPPLTLAAVLYSRASGIRLRAVFVDVVVYSTPLWGWLLFATIYFGYALPNTYYAKLYTGIPASEHVKQGLLYYLNSLNYDPATLLVIALTLAVAFAGKDARLKAAAVGIVLYLLYIVKIGGDFMSGRFFSVPFFFAVTLLAHLRLCRRVWIGIGGVCLITSLSAKYPPLFYNEDYKGIIENPNAASRTSDVTDRRGIADERGWYFRDAGLLTVLTREQWTPLNPWAIAGQQARGDNLDLVEFGTPGFYGYYAGPGVHIIDTYALGDPLLSRLPVFDPHHWKVGHYGRSVPLGYIETLQTGVTKIENPSIRKLYRITKILTRDPIWSAKRFKEIAKANLGFYRSISLAAPREGAEPPLGVGERVTLAKRANRGELCPYGTTVAFTSSGAWERFRGQGWSRPESQFCWTEGPVASLVLPLSHSDEAVTLSLRAGANINPPALPAQHVDIWVNGKKIATWEVANDQVYRATIPREFLIAPRNDLYFDFRLPLAVSPKELGTSPDGRRLGLRVSELTIER